MKIIDRLTDSEPCTPTIIRVDDKHHDAAVRALQAICTSWEFVDYIPENIDEVIYS